MSQRRPEGAARGIAAPLAALWLAAAAVCPLPAGAAGVEDPTVSFGLTALSDWDTALPLLDLARLMRPFWAYEGDAWETIPAAGLADAGILDPAGYPRRIPEGATGLRTIWAWNDAVGAEGRRGRYVLTYDGAGTLAPGGPVVVVSQEPGRIVFENETGGGFWLDITATDPEGTGDHIRNLSLVRAEHEDLLAAGAAFAPGWIELIADARELRFKDWMLTDIETAPATWADRPEPGDATWSETGAPVELMVRLANEVGADPWFTMHHLADPDYVRRFATYVRDHLDPRLKAHVEYSNETWNAAFPQFHWLREAAIADWGADVAENWGAIFSYHSKRATEVALIWQEVFGEAAADRLVNVLATQIGHFWLAEQQLEARDWAQREPDRFVPPHEVFEEFAATTYFGGAVVTDPATRAELIARVASDPAGVNAWLHDRIAQAGPVEDSLPGVEARILAQKAVSDRFGLRYTAYEGGQHLHHSFAVGGVSDAEFAAIDAALAAFVRSEEMADLYARAWDLWARLGDGPFMQFTEMGMPNRYGSWGLLSHPGDRSPRADFLRARMAEGGSWWGEGGGPQYLHGVIARGGPGADVLTGTDEEDYLLGGDGDDRIIESPGADGVNGGAGRDTYVLAGPPGDYRIGREGRGHRVSGPAGSAYLFAVERVEFADGTLRALD
ncbi:MAG: hypothetical protein N2Z62_04475 [Rhodobacteraceae bacterium]|nr:hypothetical protein [Paracoccaceae bacterium]